MPITEFRLVVNLMRVGPKTEPAQQNGSVVIPVCLQLAGAYDAEPSQNFTKFANAVLPWNMIPGGNSSETLPVDIFLFSIDQQTNNQPPELICGAAPCEFRLPESGRGFDTHLSGDIKKTYIDAFAGITNPDDRKVKLQFGFFNEGDPDIPEYMQDGNDQFEDRVFYPLHQLMMQNYAITPAIGGKLRGSWYYNLKLTEDQYKTIVDGGILCAIPQIKINIDQETGAWAEETHTWNQVAKEPAELKYFEWQMSMTQSPTKPNGDMVNRIQAYANGLDKDGIVEDSSNKVFDFQTYLLKVNTKLHSEFNRLDSTLKLALDLGASMSAVTDWQLARWIDPNGCGIQSDLPPDLDDHLSAVKNSCQTTFNDVQKYWAILTLAAQEFMVSHLPYQVDNSKDLAGIQKKQLEKAYGYLKSEDSTIPNLNEFERELLSNPDVNITSEEWYEAAIKFFNLERQKRSDEIGENSEQAAARFQHLVGILQKSPRFLNLLMPFQWMMVATKNGTEPFTKLAELISNKTHEQLDGIFSRDGRTFRDERLAIHCIQLRRIINSNGVESSQETLTRQYKDYFAKFFHPERTTTPAPPFFNELTSRLYKDVFSSTNPNSGILEKVLQNLIQLNLDRFFGTEINGDEDARKQDVESLKYRSFVKKEVTDGITLRFAKPMETPDLLSTDDDDQSRLEGILFLMRRKSDNAANYSNWHVLNAGSLEIQSRTKHKVGPVPIPVQLSHIDELNRMEVNYNNNVIGVSLVNYTIPDNESDEESDLEKKEFFRYFPCEPSNGGAELPILKPHVLRFGDSYEVLGCLVDRAGGLPDILAPENEPYDFLGENTVITGALSNSTKFQYLRRVPVGALSITPDERGSEVSSATTVKKWQQIPEAVELRTRYLMEKEGKVKSGEGNIPTVLLGNTGETYLDDQFSFHVLQPTTDSETLLAWEAPELNDQNQTYIDNIKKALSRRQNSISDENGRQTEGSLADPAVKALIFKHKEWKLDDDDNAQEKWEFKDIKTVRINFDDYNASTYLPLQFSIKLKHTNEQTTPVDLELDSSEIRHSGEPHPLEFELSEGQASFVQAFAVLEAEGQPEGRKWSRFHEGIRTESDALGDIEQEESADEDWLSMAKIIFETATTELPSSNDLWNSFSLERKGLPGSANLRAEVIAVNWAKEFERNENGLDPLEYIASYDVHRSYWRYSGLPVKVVLPDKNGNPEQYGGDFGEPPLSVYKGNPGIDEADEVNRWEAVATLSDAMRPQPIVSMPWKPKWKPGATLHIDNFQGVLHSVYAHYSLRVHSRYAAVIKKGPESVLSRDRNSTRTYRRAFRPFIDAELKTPTVLSVIPLTKLFDQKAGKNPPDDDTQQKLQTPAPVLVTLHGSGYTHGFGERLTCYLRTDLTIGDTNLQAGADIPLMIGPDPVHYTEMPTTNAFSHPYYREVPLPADGAVYTEKSSELEVFGPFGHTHETTEREPLINAVSYIIYPPDKAGPEWFAEVVLRTEMWVLKDKAATRYDYLEPKIFGLFSGPQQLRFLPEADFQYSLRKNQNGSIHTAVSFDGGKLEINKECFFNLHHTNARGIGNQGFNPGYTTHAYFILITEEIFMADGKNRSEFPVGLARIELPGDENTRDELLKAVIINETDLARMKHGTLRGRLIEIQLNGIDEKDNHYFTRKEVGNLTVMEFWKLLFPAKLEPANGQEGKEADVFVNAPQQLQDAEGMVCRLSPAFRISKDI